MDRSPRRGERTGERKAIHAFQVGEASCTAPRGRSLHATNERLARLSEVPARTNPGVCRRTIGARAAPASVAEQQRCRHCPLPCNSGVPAVLSRTRGALLLSCTSASVAESRRQTLAPDEHQAPAIPRSAPASLLHPWKSSGDAITARPYGEIARVESAADRLLATLGGAALSHGPLRAAHDGLGAKRSRRRCSSPKTGTLRCCHATRGSSLRWTTRASRWTNLDGTQGRLETVSPTNADGAHT